MKPRLSPFFNSRSWSCHTLLGLGLAVARIAGAQPIPTDHSTHQHPTTSSTTMALAVTPQSQALTDEVQELKARVARLDAALRLANPNGSTGRATTGAGGSGMAGMQAGATAGSSPMPSTPPPVAPPAMAGMEAAQSGGGNMGGMMQEMGSMMQMMGGMMGSMKPGGSEMGVMKMGGASGGMAGMAAGPPSPMAQQASSGMSTMGGMEKMDSMMGIPPGGGGMGTMKGSGTMTAALPGFPGASHLYHIGSTGFFLDHAEHISLTVPQQAALNAIKESALIAKAANQRKVDTAEQELWALTASDQPDATKIDAKIREAEKLRGNERLDFIRSIGDAAKLLTDGQRQSLLGFQPPQPAAAPARAMAPM